MMKTLGIYFGPKAISLVETDGQKVLKNVLIPLKQFSGTATEEKIPEEIKIATVIKEELTKNNIETRDVNLSLFGQDLIIRTFYMPVLPANEFYNAVRFEAKKYIPFKIEDLVYDFQVSLDSANHQNMVLFVGLKKEHLDKYFTIFTQINLKVSSIEYAGFSILRFMQLAKIKEKGVFAVVDIDYTEEDEANFIVLENGFPLFSRDIILASETGSSEGIHPVKVDSAWNLEKLKAEIRISLDFYLRKFPTKNIGSIVVIAPPNYCPELEAFVRERGLGIKFLDPQKFLDQPMLFSLGFFKAYAVNLEKAFKSNIKIDLLPSKIKAKSQKQATAVSSFLSEIKIDIKLILLAIAIIASPFIISYYRLQPVQSELTSILGSRPQVSTVQSDRSFDELNDVDYKYKEKIKIITEILQKRIFVTGQLNSISKVVPEGLWLHNFNFQKIENNLILTMAGSCYKADNDEERGIINKFLNDLKENPNFKKEFKEMKILSLDQGQSDKIILTNFVIECRNE